MQSKLPDVNSAIVRHRGGALIAMSQTPPKYSLAATELGAINALLPLEYKVAVDTQQYQDKVKGQDVLVCNYCNKQIQFEDVTFYKRSVDVNLQLLYSIKKILFWECPLCHKESPKDGTDRIIRRIQNPFYAECMPEPPRKDDFGNDQGFQHEFEKWFDIALSELENKVAKYRTDYAAQQDSEDIPDDEDDDNANNK